MTENFTLTNALSFRYKYKIKPNFSENLFQIYFKFNDL